jgi:hypothetical protein
VIVARAQYLQFVAELDDRSLAEINLDLTGKEYFQPSALNTDDQM